MATDPLILQLAVPSPLRRTFDYLPPRRHTIDCWQPGLRLRVPFGNREVVAILLGVRNHSEVPPNKLKPAHEVLDDHPILPPALLQLSHWAARYYQHPLGEALHSTLPALLRQGHAAEMSQERIWTLTDEGQTAAPSHLTRAPRQAALLRLFSQHPGGMNSVVVKSLGFGSAQLKGLEDKGLIRQRMQRHPPVEDAVPGGALTAEPALALNAEQQEAVTAIHENARQFQPFLLEGITGSGKTEVYLQAIEPILAAGRQALILVPEIGLTPQTVNRFKQRFTVPVIALHSGLTDRERLDAWLSAKHNEARIIIGTRSAIFTPLARPGIIIVDEEHDLSFKQQDGFRYSARDLAVVRARQESVPVLLGSATPSLESLHNARTGRYQWLRLTQRAGTARAPGIQLLDIRSRPLDAGLSPPLLQEIRRHLERGNQVLVFLNRRGFAPTLMCHDCGWMSDCPRCDARMTLHRHPYHLHCHHCDATRPAPATCPQCGAESLKPIGVGTERSEEALQRLLPDYPVLRVDRDSTRRKGTLDTLLARINQGEAGVLVGTQMLAKGHHFPHVTLVAVLDADSGLFSADIRGLERMGQLLFQVAGRAGRADKPGEVLVQTHQAEHPDLRLLIEQGYHDFALKLLQERRAAALPPYTFMALLRAEAPSQQTPDQFLQDARELAEQIRTQAHLDTATLLGPIPAPMERRDGRFHAQLLLQSPDRHTLQQLLQVLCPQLETLRSSRKVRWSVDVDPQEML